MSAVEEAKKSTAIATLENVLAGRFTAAGMPNMAVEYMAPVVLDLIEDHVREHRATAEELRRTIQFNRNMHEEASARAAAREAFLLREIVRLGGDMAEVYRVVEGGEA